MRHNISLFIIGIMAGGAVFAQPLPLDPAIKTGKLTNGFTYYIRKNTEPAKRVQLWLVNKVGSVLEQDNQRGLAHFMEHMSFNGTKHFPKNTLVEYLQQSGIRFGADLNAYTSFDETVYQLPIPSDDPKLLQNGLLIMRDWAQNATLDPKEINDERGVVLEEKRLGKGASERMREKTFPVLLNHSRYADRIPIGTDTVLHSFHKEAILDFYNDWYRPNLQALIVVGDINVAAIEAKIKTLFGDLKNPLHQKTRTVYQVPLAGHDQFVAVTDKENPNLILQVLIKQKESSLITAADYNNSIRRAIVNQMMAARMEELSQKPNPPFLQAGAGMDNLLGGLDAFTVSVVAKPGRLEAATRSVWAEVQRVKQFGFTQGELDRAKTDYLNYLESALKEKDKRSSQELVEEYVRLFLKKEASPGIEKETAITRAYLPMLTLATVNTQIDGYIKDTDRDIVIMVPQKDSASLPSAILVQEWLTAAAKNLTAYTDSFSGSALVGELPAAGKIVNEKPVAGIGVTQLEFANGAKVFLKPTSFKNEEIQFHAFSPGGTSLYNDSDYQSAASAAEIINASGLGKFSPADLPKILAGKSVNAEPYIAERSEGIEGSTTPKDLETALQVMYLYFTAPRKDSTVFNNIIDHAKTAIASRYADPNNVFADTVTAVLGNHAYRRSPPSIDKLNQVNLNKVYSIYSERFANAGDFTFLFAGNFNADSIKPLLEKYIGSLPSSQGKETARDLGIHPPPGIVKNIVRKGSEDKATVRLVISGDYTFTPENNIQLAGLGEILQFRITDRLREKEGGAYSPAVHASFNKLPSNRYSLTIVFGCAPANADKLVAAVREEISNLQIHGASAADITKFSTEQTRQYELQLQSNSFWLGYMDSKLENGEDLSGVLLFKDRLKEVTAASVKAAAKKYLDNGNFIELLLLPETNK